MLSTCAVHSFCKVVQYLRDRDLSLAWFGNYFYTWGLRLEGDTAYVTEAFPRTSNDVILVRGPLTCLGASNCHCLAPWPATLCHNLA
jgi:hypothetical protein